MADSLPRDQEQAKVLFLWQAEHKDFDHFFAFWPEIFNPFIGLSMGSRPVRVFLFERQMAFDHAGKLATRPRTILDRINGAFLPGITIKIKRMGDAIGTGQ